MGDQSPIGDRPNLAHGIGDLRWMRRGEVTMIDNEESTMSLIVVVLGLLTVVLVGGFIVWMYR
jgi:nitrate reductase NapE component